MPDTPDTNELREAAAQGRNSCDVRGGLGSLLCRYLDECAEALDQAKARIRSLEAVLEMLPKCADGVCRAPGDECFHRNEAQAGYVLYDEDGFEIADGDDSATWVGMFVSTSASGTTYRWYTLDQCYSSQAALQEKQA